MSAAAVTPGVRGIVVCDEVFGSDVEADVYDLEGVRQMVTVPSFPSHQDVKLFLQLECVRGGTFSGNIRIVSGTGRQVRYALFTVRFDQMATYRDCVVDLPACNFPAAGQYTIEVWFWDHNGNEAQKGSRPFDVTS